MTALGLDAPAKVNLWLRVLEREPSGYHRLDTLFCALELADRVVVEAGGSGVGLEVRGAELGPPEHNLAVRAAQAFHREAGLPESVYIVLHKRIPAGAGLGGGSSDAAATLLALNALHGRPLDAGTLRRLAETLGSDVPFFVSGATLARAGGRGELLTPLPPPPARPTLVALAGAAMPTPEAYSRLDEARWRRAPTGARATRVPATAPAAAGVAALGWADIAANSVNDFEDVVFAERPRARRLHQALADAGASPARLAGSGAAVFGVFETAAERDAAAERIAAEQPDCVLFRTATRQRMPDPELDPFR